MPVAVTEKVAVCPGVTLWSEGCVVMVGAVEAEFTVKVMPLLNTPPALTITFPVVAPDGTGATMLVELQLVGEAAVPLNVSVLVP